MQRASADSPRLLPTFESEFIGREGDLTALLRAYHQVASGRPRHVHVIAPAGLGKSRLLAEFGARCRLMRGRVVSIAALPSDRGLSFALEARLVAALGALPGAIAVAPASAAVLVRLAPTLSSRFDVTSMASAVPDDELTRSQVVRELIETVAAERMLVLMVDDLHWGDGESLAALQRVAEQLPPNLLLVTSTRPPIALGGDSSLSTRELAPLTDAHVRDMLVTLGLPADAAATALAVQAITAASAGSPLYVLQLVRQGLEDGWLRRDGERLLAVIGEDEIRLSRLDPIAGRLRELSEGDARVLLALARAGMPVGEQTLGVVVGAEVDDALERLAARGLVTPTPGGWTCAHDVIAEHVVSRSAADELRSMDAALGRELARTSTGMSEARRAARFLADGGDMGGLRDLVAQQLQTHRDAGRDVTSVAMARELVGPSLPDEQIAALVASLPMRLRIRRRTARLAAASLVFAVALMAAAASRHQVPSLIVAQHPLGSTQALTDSSLLELRPALVVEQRDGRGRLVANDGDTIDVTLRDTVSGESRTTTQTMMAGRVTFQRLLGANVQMANAVVRRRDADDSLLVRVRWGRRRRRSATSRVVSCGRRRGRAAPPLAASSSRC
ncbi:MAG: AAA family ATPase [Gemmatimonadetes bacterium]|nr:AAA family ATPase [Gemmatimonadota bacterium]